MQDKSLPKVLTNINLYSIQFWVIEGAAVRVPAHDTANRQNRMLDITVTQQSSIENPSSPYRAGVYRIGGWRVDLSSGLASQGSETVRLPSQSLALLKLLIEAPDGVATRQWLEDQLWPAGGVGEESLNNAVARLRKSLAPESGADTLIETLPKRGYRLVVAATPETDTRSERRLPLRMLALMGIVVTLLVVLFLASGIEFRVEHEGGPAVTGGGA